MKLKLLKRIEIMSAAGIALIGVLLMVLEAFDIHCFGVMNKLVTDQNGAISVLGLITLMIVVLALSLLFINVFMIGYMGEKSYKARMVALKGDKDDVVLIERQTLDEFVKTIAGKPQGVTKLVVNTDYSDMRLNVSFEAEMDMDSNIRETSAKIQQDVRHQLEEVNGIETGGISVTVTKINIPQISEGMTMPWAAKSAKEDDASEKAEKPAEVSEAELYRDLEPAKKQTMRGESEDGFDPAPMKE